jgi:predicted amidohydrolase YtcJ
LVWGQRVTPLKALKAMTINGAKQYGEQSAKGSLEVGKLTDLLVLDQNPLKVDAIKIKDVKVVETIKKGRTIFKQP